MLGGMIQLMLEPTYKPLYGTRVLSHGAGSRSGEDLPVFYAVSIYGYNT